MERKVARSPSLSTFMTPLQPDERLATLVGHEPLLRSQAARKVWAYIKEQGLQDSGDKRLINADALLAPFFGEKKQVSMFEVARLLKPHLTDL